MATFPLPARRLILAGGFAIAIAAAPAVAFFAPPTTTGPTLTANCPAGETADMFTGVCLPHFTPSTGGYGAPVVCEGSRNTTRYDCIKQRSQQGI